MKKYFLCRIVRFSLMLAICHCSSDPIGIDTIADNTDVEGNQPNQPISSPTDSPVEIPTDNPQGNSTENPADNPNETEPTGTDTELPPPYNPYLDDDDPPETNPQTDPSETEPEITQPNDKSPKILINELRTEYDRTSKHAEYIELKVITSCNLEGIKIIIKWNLAIPYTFDLPSINVKAGEYITYHLRKYDSASKDELGDNLSLSGGYESDPNARDLWASDSNVKYLHKTDIVYLEDADGNILDAVVLNETPTKNWSSLQSHFTGILENLFNQGAWQSSSGALPDYKDAVDTSTINTIYKTVSRRENAPDTNTKNDWYITELYCDTPGKPNK